MVLTPAKVAVQGENASILRTMNGTVYLQSSNGNIISNDSNNQLPQDSLESATAATNENVSMQRPNNNALVDADGATSMQSSSFVAHTLFQNQTNTGNIFDHTSEQHEPPPKSKKIISPFAPEATVPLPDLLPCWSLGTTVWKRNERERYRVRCVNEGYEKLRNHLPINSSDRRLSKTICCATATMT
uniref:BHLH domain-containing protein n=1 Tax=Ditylenchus dipsaci TaxID=166011 RepID=A0A915DM02_9BILA